MILYPFAFAARGRRSREHATELVAFGLAACLIGGCNPAPRARRDASILDVRITGMVPGTDSGRADTLDSALTDGNVSVDAVANNADAREAFADSRDVAVATDRPLARPDIALRDGQVACISRADCLTGEACIGSLCQTDPCAGGACGGPTCFAACVALGDPCAGVTCAANETCFFGRCERGCFSTPCAGGCGAGSACSQRTNSCETIRACGSTCPAGTACHIACIPPDPCAGRTCPSGQRCIGGTCTADRCAGVTCAAGSICRDGTCIDTCACSPACTGAARCVAGRCECTPQCAGALCGAADGCGGTCRGSCPNPAFGTCALQGGGRYECVCDGTCADWGVACGVEVIDSCGRMCGVGSSCSPGEYCDGRNCICNNICPQNQACGTIEAGSCGRPCSGYACPDGLSCVRGSCCALSCPDTLACGSRVPDGCDGQCVGNWCPEGQSCNGSSCECSPRCSGPCGSGDGCGGYCSGSCPAPDEVCSFQGGGYSCTRGERTCTPSCGCGTTCNDGVCQPICGAGQSSCGCSSCCSGAETCVGGNCIVQ